MEIYKKKYNDDDGGGDDDDFNVDAGTICTLGVVL